MEVTLWHWLGFGLFVAALLALDLGVFHRGAKETTLRSAARGTAAWVFIALCFNALIWYLADLETAMLFFTGYLIEWSLSMDNVFVFAVIFSYFRVPMKYQYRVLFWGILGAVAMRLTFVLVGKELIERFEWITYLLGAFLVYTGVKLCFHEEEVDPEHSWILRVARRLLPVAKESTGDRFFVREAGRFAMTPLFLVLLVVESTDVAFAVDSVPAIFSITKDPFIIFTSNIFAILGLRALYFLLAGVMGLFHYLRYGLAAILIFVGAKMLVQHWIELPPWASLVVVVSLLGIAIVASIVHAKFGGAESAAKPDGHGNDEHVEPPAEAPVDR